MAKTLTLRNLPDALPARLAPAAIDAFKREGLRLLRSLPAGIVIRVLRSPRCAAMAA